MLQAVRNRRARRTLLLMAVVASVALPGIAGTGQSADASRPVPPVPVVTSPPAAQQPAPNCGGHPTIMRDGKRLVCTFDDEFNRTTGDAHRVDPKRWIVQQTADSGYHTGVGDTKACYVDSPNNVAVSHGRLHLTVRRMAAPFLCKSRGGVFAWLAGSTFRTRYTAGMVSTYHRFSQAYGRFEVRAKLPKATIEGLQETFWLWPVNPHKYGGHYLSGEIDFAEFYSQQHALEIPYIHYVYNRTKQDASTDTNVVTTHCQIDPNRANTYVAEWKPGVIKLSSNGRLCMVDRYLAFGLPSPAPFDQPFFLILTQALGMGTNRLDPLTAPLPATTLVDYVRVWK